MATALSLLPGGIPNDVIALADDALDTTHYSSDPLDQTIACARAIMAERERCALIAAQFIDGRLYKPRFPACSYHASDIADAIRKG